MLTILEFKFELWFWSRKKGMWREKKDKFLANFFFTLTLSWSDKKNKNLLSELRLFSYVRHFDFCSYFFGFCVGFVLNAWVIIFVTSTNKRSRAMKMANLRREVLSYSNSYVEW